MKSDFPESLYKFRCFDKCDLHIRILTHNEIFFSSAAQFNDPFDCRISMQYTGTREEIVEYWKKQIANSQFPLPPGIEGVDPEEMYERGYFTSPEALELAKQFTKDFGARALGVFCLTASYSNILMWSHYSSSHSGFVVGFSTLQLKQFCYDSTFGGGAITALEVVRYSRAMPQVNAYRHNQNERFEKQFLTKAEDWCYEEEYRILMQNGPNTKATLPPNTITRVILGFQIDPSNRDRMIHVLRSRGDHLPLFQAQPSDSQFALDFLEVQY
jgi:hypothetical protein